MGLKFCLKIIDFLEIVFIKMKVILFLCGLSYGSFTLWNSNGTVQCYECESVDDKADDMNQGCWILEQEGEPLGDGRGTCLGHGCFVSRIEESRIQGMMHHIYRRCLTYPADSELLNKEKENDCIGLGSGKTGEDCYSVCFENDCNSALVFEFTSELFAFLFVTMF